MQKRICTCLLALLAALLLTVPAWAEQAPGDSFIYDTEGMLTDDQWASLEAEADRISWQYDCAVYIVTIRDYEEYADDVYGAACEIYNGQDFGIGGERSGVLLQMNTPNPPMTLNHETTVSKIHKATVSRLARPCISALLRVLWHSTHHK